MAKDPDRLAGSFETENTGGLLTGFLADEDVFDRRALWRLGSWGAASVGAVILALYANQSSIGSQREQVAAADLARQSQQIQSLAKESQNETRRLASAIETLNGDRDRLYSRVTVLEQGLDSVTGAIARQNSATATPQAVAAAAPQSVATAAPKAVVTASPQASPAMIEPQPVPQIPPPAPVVFPVATTVAAPAEKSVAAAKLPEKEPATVSSVRQTASNTPAPMPAMPLMASKSMMAPPDAAAAKLIEPDKPAIVTTAMPEVVASAPSVASESSQTTLPKVAVQRTEFAVDVGGANSVAGLRALWRGLLKSRSNAALTTLRPIIVIKEGSNGLGMRLRLVAGPLNDAAAAAKICAALTENERPCETTVFDGQRLAMNADEPPLDAKAAATKPDTTKPATTRPVARRRSVARRVVNDEPPPKPEPTTLSSFFTRH